MRNHLINIALVVLIVAILCVAFKMPAQAQSSEEVKPYEFAKFSIPYTMPDGTIYKAVHQGCELFIAVTPGSDRSVSIATGRGCK